MRMVWLFLFIYMCMYTYTYYILYSILCIYYIAFFPVHPTLPLTYVCTYCSAFRCIHCIYQKQKIRYFCLFGTKIIVFYNIFSFSTCWCIHIHIYIPLPFLSFSLFSLTRYHLLFFAYAPCSLIMFVFNLFLSVSNHL